MSRVRGDSTREHQHTPGKETSCLVQTPYVNTDHSFSVVVGWWINLSNADAESVGTVNASCCEVANKHGSSLDTRRVRLETRNVMLAGKSKPVCAAITLPWKSMRGLWLGRRASVSLLWRRWNVLGELSIWDRVLDMLHFSIFHAFVVCWHIYRGLCSRASLFIISPKVMQNEACSGHSAWLW